MGTFQYVGLPVLLGKLEAAATMSTNQGANHLVNAAQDEVTKRTGALAASIHTDGARPTGTGVEAIVATGAEVSEYDLVQHEGAGAHVIRAKNGKALNWPGAAHPVAQVNHPGNPAQKYLENPLLQMTQDFKAYCRAAMRSVF